MEAEQIGEILDELGRRIGPYGEQVWEITVRQVWIEGIVWGVGFLVLLLAALAGIRFAWVLYWRKIEVWDGDDSELRRKYFGSYSTRPSMDDAVMPSLILAFLALGSLAGLLFNLTQLLNPEYHALMRLLERLVP